MKKILIFIIHGYRYFLSPMLGCHCRFYPTCSQYAETAIERHGLFKGSWLALRRISSCHPWHTGGIDEVPHKTTRN